MPDPASTTATPRHNGALVDALCIGLPDAAMCLWCLFVWMHPLALGPETVKCVILMLLLEFILLNANGLFTALRFMLPRRRGARWMLFVSLCTLYLALAVGFALQFHPPWPFAVFGWMVANKLAWVIRNRRVTANEQVWLMGYWAVAVAAYLGAAGIGIALDVPQWGITAAIVPRLHLASSGEWFDQPHRAVAAAVFYFAAIAVFKWSYIAFRRLRQGRCAEAAMAPGDPLDAV
ncbi:MAG: hypothetical protein JSR26_09325 [Proteobacteria bacterium]|nr:hypothetical protein [Pseudomonadota bacterium]